jgi:hypothetical protein
MSEQNYKLGRNEKAYYSLLKTFLEDDYLYSQFKGSYLGIVDERLVDYDFDVEKVLGRVSKRFPSKEKFVGEADVKGLEPEVVVLDETPLQERLELLEAIVAKK